MRHLAELFEPPSLGLAVLGTAVSGVAIVGVGIGSIASANAGFSVGIGLVLMGYGILVLFGAWLGFRRNPWARGLIVAPALLHIATAVSLLQSDDTPQVAGAVVALIILVVTVVAAVLPSTREALGVHGPQDDTA
ncbi:MAG: hypothetical protein Q4P15_11180 [Propionibacteriaceae bacterium]|nr:hypothetical protein [Propionibacteriaceae bacterium]